MTLPSKKPPGYLTVLTGDWPRAGYSSRRTVDIARRLREQGLDLTSSGGVRTCDRTRWRFLVMRGDRPLMFHENLNQVERAWLG